MNLREPHSASNRAWLHRISFWVYVGTSSPRAERRTPCQSPLGEGVLPGDEGAWGCAPRCTSERRCPGDEDRPDGQRLEGQEAPDTGSHLRTTDGPRWRTHNPRGHGLQDSVTLPSPAPPSAAPAARHGTQAGPPWEQSPSLATEPVQ